MLLSKSIYPQGLWFPGIIISWKSFGRFWEVTASDNSSEPSLHYDISYQTVILSLLPNRARAPYWQRRAFHFSKACQHWVINQGCTNKWSWQIIGCFSYIVPSAYNIILFTSLFSNKLFGSSWLKLIILYIIMVDIFLFLLQHCRVYVFGHLSHWVLSFWGQSKSLFPILWFFQ